MHHAPTPPTKTNTAGVSVAEVVEQIQGDPLFILRTATEISTGSRKVSPEFTSACQNNVHALDSLSVEDVRNELERSLLGRDVDIALEWLLQVGVLDKYLPEVTATVSMAQEHNRKHKDVWQHTILVVKQAVPRPGVRWGALFHDIGKVPTRTFTSKGVHFHGHAEVGARMFDRLCRRFPFEPALRKKIRFLINHHLRSNQYSPDWSDTAVRRFAREMDAHLRDLLDLSRADITSKRPGRRQQLLKQISALSKRIDELKAKDAVQPLLRKGIGIAIMERFSLPPSKFIGDLKKELEAVIERGELEARREDDYYLAWLAKSDLLAKAISKP